MNGAFWALKHAVCYITVFKNIRRRNGVKHDQRNDRSENLNKNLIRSLESGEKSDRKPYIPRNSCFP